MERWADDNRYRIPRTALEILLEAAQSRITDLGESIDQDGLDGEQEDSCRQEIQIINGAVQEVNTAFSEQ